MKSILDKQFTALEEKYPDLTIEARADGTSLIKIPNYGLPIGWNKASSNIYFLVPNGYPVAKPDCFWTDVDLTLANGGTPLNASVNASHGGPEQLLWFSYHLSSWDPNVDDLLTYVRVINQRLGDLR